MINGALNKISKGLLSLLLALLLAGCGSSGAKSTAGEAGAIVSDTESKRIRIIFGGDLMLHMPQIESARLQDGSYDFSEYFEYLVPVFDSADLVMLNLETTLNDRGDYSGYPQFASPAALAGAMKKAGIDAVMLANNHICDRGRTGIRSTTGILAGAGIKYTGAFADSSSYAALNPLLVNADGIGLAILNYTYGTNGIPVPKGMVVNLMDTVAMEADIAKINREDIDHIVMFLHWGDEYVRRPNKAQMDIAAWCRRRGVELIIGSHPHVVQPIEATYGQDNKIRHITAYSLGNFVSNQRKRYCDGGILLTVDITRSDSTSVIEYGNIPVWVYKKPKAGGYSYSVLPDYIADTLVTEPTAKIEYSVFISDVRELLGN